MTLAVHCIFCYPAWQIYGIFEGAGAPPSLIGPGKSRLNPSSALFVNTRVPAKCTPQVELLSGKPIFWFPQKRRPAMAGIWASRGRWYIWTWCCMLPGPAGPLCCCIPGACQACWHTPGWNNPGLFQSAAVNSVACRVREEHGRRNICSSASTCLFISIFPSPPWDILHRYHNVGIISMTAVHFRPHRHARPCRVNGTSQLMKREYARLPEADVTEDLFTPGRCRVLRVQPPTRQIRPIWRWETADCWII